MIEIKNLLFRFNDILLSEEVKKEIVATIIKENIGIQIKTKEVEIKNNLIYLKIKPIYKNEILFKKDKILLELKNTLKKLPQKML